MTDQSPKQIFRNNVARGRAAFSAIDPRVRWPVIIFVVAIALAALMMAFRPALAPHAVERILPAVRVVSVEPEAVQLKVRSQGTVKPRIESNLTSEVSGSVVFVSPALVAGGHFDEGDLLLEISDQDYRNAFDSSRAAVTRAEVEYEVAQSEYKRQDRLKKQNLASQSQLDQADRAYRVAEANLIEARINLEQSEIDIRRTRIHAPFKGRVRTESVDLGQFVARGEAIAELYADDSVEVRLPIANRQFAYLDIPPTARGMLEPEVAPAVRVFGEYAGVAFEWHGAMVRTEAVIDESTRMFYGVARVQNPVANPELPPLVVGLFVHAEIDGRIAEGVVRLPRAAIRDGDNVLVVDAENRLRFRQVDIMRIEYDEVLVKGGLESGERVCISPMQVAVEGMEVQPIDVTPVREPLEQLDEGDDDSSDDESSDDDSSDDDSNDEALEETGSQSLEGGSESESSSENETPEPVTTEENSQPAGASNSETAE